MRRQTKAPASNRTAIAGMARLLSVAVLALPGPARAQDEQRGMADMRIAEQYSAHAADAQRLEDVRANLRQALNCLEGAQGPDYRRSAGDPCSGSGVVRQLPDGSVNKITVEKAIRLAAVGVTFHDFDPAHFTAQAVRAVLLEGTR
jgi:hypothetical protein